MRCIRLDRSTALGMVGAMQAAILPALARAWRHVVQLISMFLKIVTRGPDIMPLRPQHEVVNNLPLNIAYRIAGKFGRELNLADWRTDWATAKLKSAKISYLHIYVWRSRTKPPNLNPPVCLQWQFGTQPPNLIPANISGYTVLNTTQYSLYRM